MLFNEPKLLKCSEIDSLTRLARFVSVLFNEPKLLKYKQELGELEREYGFSALQRAEIAEIAVRRPIRPVGDPRFSALQRAEIAEIHAPRRLSSGKSAFQCSSTSRNC